MVTARRPRLPPVITAAVGDLDVEIHVVRASQVRAQHPAGGVLIRAVLACGGRTVIQFCLSLLEGRYVTAVRADGFAGAGPVPAGAYPAFWCYPHSFSSSQLCLPGKQRTPSTAGWASSSWQGQVFFSGFLFPMPYFRQSTHSIFPPFGDSTVVHRPQPSQVPARATAPSFQSQWQLGLHRMQPQQQFFLQMHLLIPMQHRHINCPFFRVPLPSYRCPVRAADPTPPRLVQADGDRPGSGRVDCRETGPLGQERGQLSDGVFFPLPGVVTYHRVVFCWCLPSSSSGAIAPVCSSRSCCDSAW